MSFGIRKICLVALAIVGSFGVESLKINHVVQIRPNHGAKELTSDQRNKAYEMNEKLIEHTVKQVLLSVKNVEVPWESFRFDGDIEVVKGNMLSIEQLRVDNINLRGLDFGDENVLDKIQVRLNRRHGEVSGEDGEWFIEIDFDDIRLDMTRERKNAMRIYYKPRGVLGRAFVPKRVLEPEVSIALKASIKMGIEWSFDDVKRVYVPKFKLMKGKNGLSMSASVKDFELHRRDPWTVDLFGKLTMAVANRMVKSQFVTDAIQNIINVALGGQQYADRIKPVINRRYGPDYELKGSIPKTIRENLLTPLNNLVQDNEVLSAVFNQIAPPGVRSYQPRAVSSSENAERGVLAPSPKQDFTALFRSALRQLGDFDRQTSKERTEKLIELALWDVVASMKGFLPLFNVDTKDMRKKDQD